MAFTPVSPKADAALLALFPAPASQIAWGEAISKGETYFLVDAEVEFAARPSMREMARLRGWRSSLFVPLLRNQRPIGAISVTRVEPGRFDDHHVQLLKTFADQAVIAIEKYAAVRRGAGQDPRPFGSTDLPDRKRQHPQGHCVLTDRC